MADLVRDAQAVTAALAAKAPYESTAALVHSGAIVQHALALGLIEPRGSFLDTLKVLADAHPALEGLADPAVNQGLTIPCPDLDAVEVLWTRHSIADRPERAAGHALGDLYQALSVESRKGRALCQTPKFVADLLLDLTIEDAMEEFGTDLRLIDPSCGTGHILVESLIRMWVEASSRNKRRRNDHWVSALTAVHGVDLDPYAAAVARYRLLAVVCGADGRRLRADQVPTDLPANVASANSLLDESEPLLKRGRYHVVVGNPPYITVKDKAVNEAIRARWPEVCHGKYSLALPFFALMTDLAMPGGWVAQITTNSFMKREFGKRFIKNYLPRYDLRWVIDTSGTYIPGFGTPTVILVHRNQAPSTDAVTVIQGVQGEPTKPADPAEGVVWGEIASHVRKRLAFRRFAAEASPSHNPSTERTHPLCQ